MQHGRLSRSTLVPEKPTYPCPPQPDLPVLDGHQVPIRTCRACHLPLRGQAPDRKTTTEPERDVYSPTDVAPDSSPADSTPREPAAGGTDENGGRSTPAQKPAPDHALDDAGTPVGLEGPQGDHVLDEKLGLVYLLLHEFLHLSRRDEHKRNGSVAMLQDRHFRRSVRVLSREKVAHGAVYGI